MAETEPMAMIAGIVGTLAALILAWRAYRSASAENEQRNREKKE